MKTRKFLWGLLACAALSACSSDEVDNNTKEFKDKAYMRVKIAMAGEPSSRGTGGDYVYGESTEQTLNNIRFFFYDENDKFMTEGNTTLSSGDLGVTANPEENKYWEAKTKPIITLKLKKAEYPSKVVAYANIGADNIDFGVDEQRTLQSDGEMFTANNLTVESFVMTSSTYFDNGKINSTTVTPGNFHETEESAKNDDDLVTIYLERLPAKVMLDNTSVSESDELTDASGNVLKFFVSGFALSGTNTQSFLQKQLKDDWTTNSPWNGWTLPNEFRCFWAKDRNYDSAPLSGELSFATLNDFDADQDNEFSFDKVAKYCYENTLTLSEASVNLYERATYALVFGTYKIKWSDQADFTDLDQSFYMYSGTAYLADGLKEEWVGQITDVYVENGGSYSVITKENCDLVSNGTLDGVTLSLKEGTYYKDVNGAAVYTSQELNDKKTNWKNIYKATGYRNGIGYFPVLIEHFGNSNSNDKYDTTTELGVVRNHVYNIKINSIKGMAEGVYDPEKPIIPNSEEKEYFLASELRILSWKTVSQDVNL